MVSLLELSLWVYAILGSSAYGWLLVRKSGKARTDSEKFLYSLGAGLVLSLLVIGLSYALDTIIHTQNIGLGILGTLALILAGLTEIQKNAPSLEPAVQQSGKFPKQEKGKTVQYEEEIPELTEKEKIKQIILEKARKSIEDEKAKKEIEKQKRMEEKRRQEAEQRTNSASTGKPEQEKEEKSEDDERLLEKELQDRLKEKPEEKFEQKTEEKQETEQGQKFQLKQEVQEQSVQEKNNPKIKITEIQPAALKESSEEKSEEEKLMVLKKLREKLQKLANEKTEGQTKPWEVEHSMGIQEGELTPQEQERIQTIQGKPDGQKGKINVKKLKSGLEEITIDRDVNERIVERIQELQAKEKKEPEEKKAGLLDKLKKLGKKE